MRRLECKRFSWPVVQSLHDESYFFPPELVQVSRLSGSTAGSGRVSNKKNRQTFVSGLAVNCAFPLSGKSQFGTVIVLFLTIGNLP